MRHKSPLYLLCIITIAIFVVESFIMLILPYLPSFSAPITVLIDSFFLIVLCFPLLYLFLVRPLQLHFNAHMQADDALRESEEKFRKISASATDAILMIDNNECVSFWNEAATKMFGFTSEMVIGKYLHNLIMPKSYKEAHIKGFQRFKETGEGSVIGKSLELEAIKKDGSNFPIELSISAIKLREQWNAIGIVRDISERKASEKKIENQLRRFTALRSIDRSINASLDLRVTLDVILDQVISLLLVDAADILLYKPHLQTLEYGAGTGFRTQALQYTQLKIGEGHAGLAALEQRIVHISDLREKDTGFKRSKQLDEEDFVSYYGVPLMAKGTVKGVLEVFNRSNITPDQDWLDFQNALAGQAAIAIDNATLYDNLQRSNIDLVMAYDATIEGWSRALDLRDKETEGHSRRVTELTLKIARALGIGEAEQADLRRGALLHDIGKMGIPDKILQKPGPLEGDEWEIMSRHPTLAYEMISPISYLRPALDIPYCHHEKWDGTGYPRRLRGEQIPLGARIFAVVDIFDALRSDRPYRPAWTKEKVLEHIRSLAGSHLDPEVVEKFLKIETDLSHL